MGEILYKISIWTIPVLLAVPLHEVAHGWVAKWFGDDTAYRLGRLSLNPLRHVDPFGTIIMPGLLLAAGSPFMFGYAKPVPVNFGRLNNPRRDMVWVALAGPGVNLLLAVVAALLYHGIDVLPDGVAPWAARNLENTIYFNVILAVFNMLPIPPLDGGRVAVGILPRAIAYPLSRLERTGVLIVIGALFLLPWLGAQLHLNLDVAGWLVGWPAEQVLDFILRLTGHG